MATRRMLIDATHPEETRVVVLSGNKLEEFDVESASRRQLKGNIYLAKVTRVEPSLQAAFVEYGGNRHGFLPFSEIHPDYFQIPVEDREAIKAEEDDQVVEDGEPIDADDQEVEELGGEDIAEEAKKQRKIVSHRNYKIQEVIKRRQILLIQVVKEERGNKGAALTTYISLAGRHCVLMPNTARGGGISRKITSAQDRRRLKTILADLNLSEGMAMIVRTAGAQRSKAEIKRDHEYLTRLWDTIRSQTLESTAPCLIYEEANLIKRSIRDLYSRDIEEIIVEGDDGYRAAKDFMKMLIPSHAKKVQPYKDEIMPLFHRYQVEGQLDGMHSPTVQLKSGGYIVINPTEALVSIDVNSGRATKERNIEETALKTNLEAADEIARQLRLRDLAGLIVIDFIDMEGNRNQNSVERRLKEAMRQDRARIQIGRISPFGLLEMSRQRLRPSLLETSSEMCPHCEGTGVRRSIESTALSVLRAIEEEGIRRRTSEMIVHVASGVALYILNRKRVMLGDIETRYDFKVEIAADDELIPPAIRIDRLKQKPQQERGNVPVVPESGIDGYEAPEEEEVEEVVTEETEENGGRRKRRRRGRRRRGEPRDLPVEAQDEQTEESDAEEEHHDEQSEEDGDEQPRRRRRRGKRGGRRRRRDSTDAFEETEADANAATDVNEAQVVSDEQEDQNVTETEASSGEKTEEPDEKSRRRRRPRKSREEIEADSAEEAETGTASSDEAEKDEKPKRKTTRRRTAKKKDAEAAETAADDDAAVASSEEKPKRKPRRRTAKKQDDEVSESDKKSLSPPPSESTEAVMVEPTAKEPLAAEQSVVPFEEKPVTVVRSDGSEEAIEKKPTRGGWWRRRN